MPRGIRTISPGGVNCYLIAAGGGYILVDTGLPNKRADIDRELESAGCGPGDLKLIVLTHGDYDHAGNAAHLREKHGAVIAMHSADSGRVERGDWSWGSRAKPDRFSILFRVVSLLIRPGEFDTFEPDVSVEDEQDLAEYGFEARALHLPGHTKGSIGVLTATGDLFCGDLMDSIRGRPDLQFFIDDMTAATASMERLRSLSIGTVYPGHGRPFPMEAIWRRRAPGQA